MADWKFRESRVKHLPAATSVTLTFILQERIDGVHLPPGTTGDDVVAERRLVMERIIALVGDDLTRMVQLDAEYTKMCSEQSYPEENTYD